MNSEISKNKRKVGGAIAMIAVGSFFFVVGLITIIVSLALGFHRLTGIASLLIIFIAPLIISVMLLGLFLLVIGSIFLAKFRHNTKNFKK